MEQHERNRPGAGGKSAGASDLGTSLLEQSGSETPTDHDDFLFCPDHQRDSQVTGASTPGTIFNALNVLVGVGLLTVPYALATSGYGSLLLLTAVGATCCYTGLLLRRCVDLHPGCSTYPEIGFHAFGVTGQRLVAVLLYLELYSCSVEFLIMPADNLAAIFPNFNLFGLGRALSAKQGFIILSAILLLPLAWLRDMSSIAIVSFSGLIASVLSIALVAWEGLAYTGFNHLNSSIALVDYRSLPLAAVFVSPLYTSMATRSDYNFMLKFSFAAALVLYLMMAVLGVAVIGPDIRDQITLSMQAATPGAFPTRAIIYMVIVSPLAKYPLTLAPVGQALEEYTQSWPCRPRMASTIVRTLLVAGSACIALSIPFFAYFMGLIGAALSMMVCVVLPSVCYGKLMKDKLSSLELVTVGCSLFFGICMAGVGTYGSILRIWHAGG